MTILWLILQAEWKQRALYFLCPIVSGPGARNIAQLVVTLWMAQGYGKSFYLCHWDSLVWRGLLLFLKAIFFFNLLQKASGYMFLEQIYLHSPSPKISTLGKQNISIQYCTNTLYIHDLTYAYDPVWEMPSVFHRQGHPRRGEV